MWLIPLDSSHVELRQKYSTFHLWILRERPRCSDHCEVEETDHWLRWMAMHGRQFVKPHFIYGYHIRLNATVFTSLLVKQKKKKKKER